MTKQWKDRFGSKKNYERRVLSVVEGLRYLLPKDAKVVLLHGLKEVDRILKEDNFGVNVITRVKERVQKTK